MALVARPLQLCFTCHTNFLSAQTVKHTPVESGDCQSCHAPHQSPNKKLLLKTGKELCFDCHDDFLQKARVKHQPVENGECLSCHNAHASNNKKLVLKNTPAQCWDCHDNFIEKAKFVHDPVGDCNTCHNPHASDEPKLLVKNKEKLCSDCHEAAEINAVKSHAAGVGRSCLACHEAHVGQDKYLLTAAGRAAAASTKGATP